MPEVNPSLSVITLNVNSLNPPITVQRQVDWVIKQVPLCALYKSSLHLLGHNEVKSSEMNKIFYKNRNPKRTGQLH